MVTTFQKNLISIKMPKFEFDLFFISAFHNRTSRFMFRQTRKQKRIYGKIYLMTLELL